MNKARLQDYLGMTDFDITNMPVDLYFLHERINNNEKHQEANVPKQTDPKPLPEVLPNTLQKYSYNGFNAKLPQTAISQSLNYSKIINFENTSK